ncbi:MAG: HlyD family efflux transporter periplasmic adaptor subunit, partial [Desulfobacteraceae bacterium]
YVPETQLGRVRLGQEAEVISDTFPEKRYRGRVTFISPEAEFTPKNVQTKEERVKLVFRIKVTLKNPNQELKPGLPVDVILKQVP